MGHMVLINGEVRSLTELIALLEDVETGLEFGQVIEGRIEFHPQGFPGDKNGEGDGFTVDAAVRWIE